VVAADRTSAWRLIPHHSTSMMVMGLVSLRNDWTGRSSRGAGAGQQPFVIRLLICFMMPSATALGCSAWLGLAPTGRLTKPLDLNCGSIGLTQCFSKQAVKLEGVWVG